jgi:hypothetical protein
MFFFAIVTLRLLLDPTRLVSDVPYFALDFCPYGVRRVSSIFNLLSRVIWVTWFIKASIPEGFLDCFSRFRTMAEKVVDGIPKYLTSDGLVRAIV